MTTTVGQYSPAYGYEPDPFGFWRGLRTAVLISLVLWGLIFYVGCGCKTTPATDPFPWHGDGPNPPKPEYLETGLEDRG